MFRKALTAPVAALLAVATLAMPASASADGFNVVSSFDRFVELVDGRELRRFGIRMNVSPGGEIVGRAFGYDVTGAWTWEDGYFCRDLNWGGDDLGYNCQMVQVNGDTLRFTTDRGEGIYADLSIR